MKARLGDDQTGDENEDGNMDSMQDRTHSFHLYPRTWIISGPNPVDFLICQVGDYLI